MPPAQRTGNHDRFERAVGSLGNGSLLLPPPFDVTTSAALAANRSKGEEAVRSFATTRAGMRRSFRMQIHEVVEGSDDIAPREIVSTVQARLADLLEIAEALCMEQAEEGKAP